jgi:hypothetical protein
VPIRSLRLAKTTADAFGAQTCPHAHETILDLIANDDIVVGAIDMLAYALGMTVTDLRTALRELLEGGQIRVEMAPGGQVSIRRGNRPLASHRLPA